MTKENLFAIILWLIWLLFLVFNWVVWFDLKERLEEKKKDKRQHWVYERHIETVMLQKKMIDLWYKEELTDYIINKCKGIEEEKICPRQCVIRATAIWVAESSAGKRATSNNIRWFRNREYVDEYKAFDDWLKSYEKYWYKHRSPSDFINKSRYCVDEHSSNDNSCPNWRKNTNKVIKELNKIPLIDN